MLGKLKYVKGRSIGPPTWHVHVMCMKLAALYFQQQLSTPTELAASFVSGHNYGILVLLRLGAVCGGVASTGQSRGSGHHYLGELHSSSARRVDAGVVSV